jgi:predicted alpha/beta-hydrolase family hydrolase
VTDVVDVVTTQGTARLHVDRARRTRAVVVLGHGAGGGVDAADLAALAGQLPGWGLTAVRVEQPWRVAGRRVAVAPARLDEAWLATQPAWPEGPRVVGGRSAGARVACRTAVAVAAVGVVALAFPLHPPGRPDRSRSDELVTGLPTMVVQGTRDAFGGPDELPQLPGLTVVAVPGADHAFSVTRSGPGTRAETLQLVVESVARFVLSVVR